MSNASYDSSGAAATNGTEIHASVEPSAELSTELQPGGSRDIGVESTPRPTPEGPTIHTEMDGWRKADSEWFTAKAHPDLPKGLPATLRDQWRVAYLIEREAQPVERERIVNGVNYIFHKIPTVGQVFQRMCDLLISATLHKLNDLERRIAEVHAKSALFGWDLIDSALKANLVDFLMCDDPKLRIDMTKKAVDMMIKLGGADARDELREALFAKRGEKLDVIAKLQKSKEEAAKDRKLLGEEEAIH